MYRFLRLPSYLQLLLLLLIFTVARNAQGELVPAKRGANKTELSGLMLKRWTTTQQSSAIFKVKEIRSVETFAATDTHIHTGTH